MPMLRIQMDNLEPNNSMIYESYV